MRSHRAAAILLLSCLSVLHASERFRASEPHMGSVATITLYADTGSQAQQAFVKAFARIAQLDAILTDYNPDSELSRVCGAGGKPHADLARVMQYSGELAAETDGAFDIAAGSVTHLWRRARQRKRVPTAEEIREALKGKGTECDAGGIAKGYAADQALAALKTLGIRSALVAMSGDLALGDPPPGRTGWRVNVGNQIRTLHNVGVSTSGDEFQYLDLEGVRYSHIVDPRTGYALRNSAPVAVIAKTAMEADAIGTAVSVGGAGLARRLQKTHNIQIIVSALPASARILPATPAQSR